MLPFVSKSTLSSVEQVAREPQEPEEAESDSLSRGVRRENRRGHSLLRKTPIFALTRVHFFTNTLLAPVFMEPAKVKLASQPAALAS